MFLATLVSKAASPGDLSPLVKAVKDGLCVDESSILFSISPSSVQDDAQVTASTIPPMTSTPSSGFFSSPAQKSTWSVVEQEGDIAISSTTSLDSALWMVGGAAISLRLVQLANVHLLHHSLPTPSMLIIAQTSHELSRTLGILTDGLRNNWQNSEDMERLRKNSYIMPCVVLIAKTDRRI